MDILEKYKNSKDVVIKKIDDFPYYIIYQERMCNLKEFMKYFSVLKLIDKLPYEIFPLVFDKINLNEDIDQLLFDGEIILVGSELIRFRISNRPERSISDSILDSDTLESPRDAFTENIKTNLALIRIRLKNANLDIKEYLIGRRTKARVYLLSINDITDKEIVEKTDNILKNIDIDTVSSSNSIKTFFNRLNILPQTHQTQSPDLAMSNLYEGQCLILVDGLSVGIMLPETIYFITKEKGDLNHPFWYNFLIKIILFTSIFISINGLALFYSFIEFHKILPINIMDHYVKSEKGVFLPLIFQILFMLFILEMYQFITIRSPKITVNTVVVVIGGFLLSEKIIETKLISVFVLSITAFSFITTFIISNDSSFISSISYFRIINLLSSLVFGIFGLTISNLLIIFYTYKKNIFNIHYFYPFIPFDIIGIYKMFLVKSSKYDKLRPKNLCKIDEVMK